MGIDYTAVIPRALLTICCREITKINLMFVTFESSYKFEKNFGEKKSKWNALSICAEQSRSFPMIRNAKPELTPWTGARPESGKYRLTENKKVIFRVSLHEKNPHCRSRRKGCEKKLQLHLQFSRFQALWKMTIENYYKNPAGQHINRWTINCLETKPRVKSPPPSKDKRKY